MSIFTHLFTSNIVPTDIEVKRIKSLTVKTAADVKALEAEISRTQAHLQELICRREQLRGTMVAYETLVSPVRRMPPEVLQNIFVHCLPRRYPVMHKSEAPVLLTQICSGWRNVALHTPELWSSLHIVCPCFTLRSPSSSSPSFRLQCEAVRQWLGRSGTRPLRISFAMTMPPHDHGDQLDLSAPLLQLLLPYRRRWQHLELQVPMESLNSLGLVTEDVPTLEQLNIQENLVTLGQETRWPDSIIAMMNTPSLRSLSLNHKSGQFHLPPIEWSQLTELRLEAFSSVPSLNTQMILTTLQLCINLRVCILGVPLSQTDLRSRHGLLVEKPIEVPHLRKLCFIHHHRRAASHQVNLFDNLVLPELRSIEFGHGGEVLSAFRDLLLRSHCSLESFEIQSLLGTTDALIGCLQLAPKLSTLIVSRDLHTGPPNRIASVLTLKDETTGTLLCPNLERLKFVDPAFSDEALIMLIRSRWDQVPPGVKRLKSVHIKFSRDAISDIRPEIQTLRDEGLDIDVVYPMPRDTAPVTPASRKMTWPSPWEGLA
ncbi:hypothetical protein BD779DRAFT_1669178 [Infundibulicybe gibba]|nr:hypothetical protein BD779DRAFT_1669178 [Infundibulicybe gibba]